MEFIYTLIRITAVLILAVIAIITAILSLVALPFILVVPKPKIQSCQQSQLPTST